MIVSIETAKKLKQAGRTKEVYFVWVEGGKLGQPNRSEVHPTEVMKNRIVSADSSYSLYSSPAAQEILDELPKKIKEEINLEIHYYHGEIEIMYTGSEKLSGCGCCYEDVTLGYFKGKNLTELLASLRLRCKENKYI